jgi:tetratricopeptide (TPR) repeat protein
MTETSLTTSQPTAVTTTPKKEKKLKGKKDSFTKLQSFLLIFLTLVISVGGWYAVGKYFFWTDIDMKRVNAQLEYLQKQVQAEPNNSKTRVELGYTYTLKGKNDLAIKEFNQALSLDEKYFDAYYNLGLVLNKEKRYNEALDNFVKAAEISPKDYKVHLQKGISYRGLKMYKEASESLSQANKLMPTSSDIIYEIGRVAEDQGQTESAIAIYKEALSYDPLYKDAVKALERLQK